MSSSSSDQERVKELYKMKVEEETSGEEAPMSEWSSLEVSLPEENMKKVLAAEGLYSPGSGELCAKYVPLSDSDIGRHPYYNYPAVTDPDIESAILAPETPVTYTDDGQELYKALCLEMNQCLVRLFHKNLLTEEINLSYYCVNPFGVHPMAIALQYNKIVKCFKLTDNFLNDDACYHLGRMLTTNTTLKELVLNGCCIGASGMLRLGSGLIINRTLEAINLSRNCLEEQGGMYFAKQLDDGATIPRVNLSYNKLGRQTAIALIEALEFKNKLTHLDLSWNNFFHIPSIAKLLDTLAKSKVLQELNLARNALEGERVAYALQGILEIPSLMILDLRDNRFRDEAIELIIAKLFKAKKLVTLDLSSNPLSTSDALAVLQKMLKPRVKLQNLYLVNVCVNKKFLTVLENVRKMKSRQNFVINYGHVLQNWTTAGPDARDLILNRADYLGKRDKKNKVDVALFFLQVDKEYTRPIPNKDLIERLERDGIPLDDNLVNELSFVFPGPKTAKTRTIDVHKIVEYIERIWPDRKLPPTPPPEPEPGPEPIAEPPKGKGKGKGKK